MAREGVPNPGSREAQDQGCMCPVMDNWRGSDELGRIRGFWVVEGCPLHDGGRGEQSGKTHDSPRPVGAEGQTTPRRRA